MINLSKNLQDHPNLLFNLNVFTFSNPSNTHIFRYVFNHDVETYLQTSVYEVSFQPLTFPRAHLWSASRTFDYNYKTLFGALSHCLSYVGICKDRPFLWALEFRLPPPYSLHTSFILYCSINWFIRSWCGSEVPNRTLRNVTFCKTRNICAHAEQKLLLNYSGHIIHCNGWKYVRTYVRT